ncbi:MAG: hypothetical protein BGO55_19720 [Sphingobacteriales bacterium 50-39]|nr:MAG: hypothetical protein BGO55_19720 [Sphingobacteriales bacterium 50-39]
MQEVQATSQPGNIPFTVIAAWGKMNHFDRNDLPGNVDQLQVSIHRFGDVDVQYKFVRRGVGKTE